MFHSLGVQRRGFNPLFFGEGSLFVGLGKVVKGGVEFFEERSVTVLISGKAILARWVVPFEGVESICIIEIVDVVVDEVGLSEEVWDKVRGK